MITKTMKNVLFLFVLCFVNCSRNNDIDKSSKFQAVCIPDMQLIEINIDGQLDDWNWVSDKYRNYPVKWFNPNKIKNDVSERFSPMVLIGWSNASNKVYLAIEVEDDLHVSGNEIDETNYNINDCLEVGLDPSQNGGPVDWNNIYEGKITFLYFVASENFKKSNLKLKLGPKWQEPELKYGYSVKTDSIRKKQIIQYEIELSLFDYWNNVGPDISNRHVLEAEQKIGIIFNFIDVDKTSKSSSNIKSKKTVWSSSPDFGWKSNANYYQEVILNSEDRTYSYLAAIVNPSHNYHYCAFNCP